MSARVEVSALGGPAFTFNVIRELEKPGRLSEGNFESLACASRTGNREYSMVWIIMADVVAALHAAYIVFVVAGFAAILAGSAARWQCVQNIYFRITHLAMILLVCLGVTLGITCPLTRLENALRLKGGQTGYARDFIGYWFDRIIFHDASPWVFATAYFTFGALILLSFWFVPVRSLRRRRC